MPDMPAGEAEVIRLDVVEVVDLEVSIVAFE
jgi:hypothetical protein